MVGGTRDLINALISQCRLRRFDVFAYGCTNSYNNRILKDQKEEVLKRFPDNRLVFCVGNSENLWERVKHHKIVNKSKHPLNELSQNLAKECEKIIQSHMNAAGKTKLPSVSNFYTDMFQQVKQQIILLFIFCEGTTYFSHKATPFLVSFQRLVTSLRCGCVLHEKSHLALHHKFGPWHAWRFCIVLPGEWGQDHGQIGLDFSSLFSPLWD